MGTSHERVAVAVLHRHLPDDHVGYVDIDDVRVPVFVQSRRHGCKRVSRMMTNKWCAFLGAEPNQSARKADARTRVATADDQQARGRAGGGREWQVGREDGQGVAP